MQHTVAWAEAYPILSGILIRDALRPQYIGEKFGVLCPIPPFKGSGVPILHNVAWPESIVLPSGILIHPTVWPQQTWAENWTNVPLLGRGSWVPISHNQAGAEAYLHTKFHLDPSNRLATIHQRHRQTGQDRATGR